MIADNFEGLSRFVAGVGRLKELSNLVLPKAAPEPDPDVQATRIELRPGTRFALESLTLRPPQSERVLIKELRLALQPGEALLINGDAAAASRTSSFFRSSRICGWVRYAAS
ncbi:MAG: hypothetical protein V4633_00320 [Pseudomonadota bacterium]